MVIIAANRVLNLFFPKHRNAVITGEIPVANKTIAISRYSWHIYKITGHNITVNQSTININVHILYMRGLF